MQRDPVTSCHRPVTGSGVRGHLDPVVTVPLPLVPSFQLTWCGRGWPGVSPSPLLWAPPVTQEEGELPE